MKLTFRIRNLVFRIERTDSFRSIQNNLISRLCLGVAEFLVVHGELCDGDGWSRVFRSARKPLPKLFGYERHKWGKEQQACLVDGVESVHNLGGLD